MTAYALLQAVTQVLFVIIAVLVTTHAVVQRRKATVDIALLFGAASAIVAITWVYEVVHSATGRFTSFVTAALLLALPYLLVRLLDDFTVVPRPLMLVATATFAGCTVAVAVSVPPYAGLLVLVAVAYIVGLSLYAAYAFIVAARRARGVTQRRMQAAAAGAVCLGLDILLVGIAVAAPQLAALWRVLSTVAALGCGVAFFAGFAPPLWLRRTWREPEVRAFLGRAASLAHLSSSEAIVQELERGAAAAVGVKNAVIGLWDEDAGVLRYGTSGREESADQFVAGQAFVLQRPIFSADAAHDDPGNAPLYRTAQARAILAAPIVAGARRIGVLCVYAPRAPLFAEDDLALVSLLANQAAVVLESRALIDEAARVQAREEAARLKDDFLSAAAHDLKTPLTSVVAQAQLLARRARKNPAAPADLQGIERIVNEAQRLRRLVLEVLDVSRIEQGALVLHLETVDLVALAGEAAERHMDSLHRVKLDVVPSVTGLFDWTRIGQLIDNLLDNAVKYSPDGGDICVRVWREGHDARMAVSDPGIGIPAPDLAALFKRFHRGGNVDVRQFAGIGLGLFICSAIVEQHGGRIWASSPGLGQGSTFFVSLPIREAPPSAASPLQLPTVTVTDAQAETA